ncbi:MAG: ester cyclase [Solirubrobacterales bacterium]
MPRRSRACPWWEPRPSTLRRGARCDHEPGEFPKRLIRRYYDDVLTHRRLDVFEHLIAPDFVGHDPSGATMDRVGYHDAVRMLHDGFGSLVVKIDDQIAEHDRVTTRWTATGLHTGTFAGIGPTWREVTISGIDIHRLDGDRVVEMWEQLDLASLLAQLL